MSNKLTNENKNLTVNQSMKIANMCSYWFLDNEKIIDIILLTNQWSKICVGSSIDEY